MAASEHSQWTTLDLDELKNRGKQQEFDQALFSQLKDDNEEAEAEAEEEESYVDASEFEDDPVEDGSKDDQQNEVPSEADSGQKDTPKSKDDQQTKPSRSEKRIQQLLAEKKAAEERAQQYEQELSSLRSQSTEQQQKYYDTQLTSYDEQLRYLKKERARAREDGDLETEQDLEEKMAEARINKRIAEAQKERLQNETKTQQQQQPETTTQNQQVPEAAQSFLERNPWFFTNEGARNYANVVGNAVYSEGFDPTTQEYYEEVESRMKQRMPELFASPKKNSVEYTQEDEKENTTPENSSNSEANTSSKKAGNPGVAGSSRTPVGNRNSLPPLTAEEKKMASHLGLSEDQYRKAKKRRQQGSGWVSY